MTIQELMLAINLATLCVSGISIALLLAIWPSVNCPSVKGVLREWEKYLQRRENNDIEISGARGQA